MPSLLVAWSPVAMGADGLMEWHLCPPPTVHHLCPPHTVHHLSLPPSGNGARGQHGLERKGEGREPGALVKAWGPSTETGQVRAGQGRAGHGWAGQGRAGQGTGLTGQTRLYKNHESFSSFHSLYSSWFTLQTQL
jgi:hypothetical protein